MTLVEVLVASVLLGVGVAGLMSVASMAVRNQGRSEQRATALWLAQEKLAEVELRGPYAWMVSEPTQGMELREGVGYEWTLNIEQEAVGELFTVGVEVNWTAGGSRGGKVELETWLNDYEAAALIPREQREEATPAEANRPSGG